MPCTYTRHAYEEVLRWLDDTPIKYQPNPKKVGSKSFHRYDRYSKARTVGQALRLGSFHSDLLFDYERGHLRATGGPKRKGLVDPNRIAWDDSWTRTDKILSTMHRKWISWTRTFAVADRLGVDRRNLATNRAGRISVELHASRIEADAMAKAIFHEAVRQNAPISDADVLHVLRLWGFKRNTTRHNVMPVGATWVHSDTLGLISSYDGTVSVKAATRRHPFVPRLLCRWLEDRTPKELRGFSFTSINLNSGYAAKLHRDSHNDGPSMIAAFGDFVGGLLRHWPEGDRGPLSALRPEDAVAVDLGRQLLLFDGTRGHLVEPFEGERFSVVFFSIARSARASEADREALRGCGIPFPSAGALERQRGLAARVWERSEPQRARGAEPQRERAKASLASREGSRAQGPKRRALEAFVACSDDTAVAYAPSAKTAETHPGSYERYTAYSQARTLGEALALGSSGSDLLYDWQAGFLKISGARKRQRSSREGGRFGRLLGRWRRALQD